MPSTDFASWPQWVGFQTFVESDEMKNVTLQVCDAREMVRTPEVFAPRSGSDMDRPSVSFFGSLKQTHVQAFYWMPGDDVQRASLRMVKITGETPRVPGVEILQFTPKARCLWTGWYYWGAFKC